jgi:hypothetical protein
MSKLTVAILAFFVALCALPVHSVELSGRHIMVLVDDTIHFINQSQLEFERCGHYAESTRRTFLSVGGARCL